MVSKHADVATYSAFLRRVKFAIESLAKDILAGNANVHIDGVPEEEIIQACEAVNLDGFASAFFMIDGDNAERIAIEQVFRGTPIRACQFHVMQACKSRGRSIYGRSPEGQKKTQLCLAAIRMSQRCPESDQWDEYYAALRDDINELSNDEGQAWEQWDIYLKRAWFSDYWRPCVVDYGMPPHVTRDGPWSTNNYTEAAFRTFDRVFLACRANRR